MPEEILMCPPQLRQYVDIALAGSIWRESQCGQMTSSLPFRTRFSKEVSHAAAVPQKRPQMADGD